MAATLMETQIMRLRRSPNARLVHNFHLVWLDRDIDEINNDDCRNSIIKLRQVVNSVSTFTDLDECIDFVTDIQEEKTFMLISEAFCQTIVPIVQDMSQVTSFYIFCKHKLQQEKWTQQWPKVKGVFEDITSICEALKYVVQNCDQNSVTINFIKSNDGTSVKNLDQLDQSFMYTQLIKEILLTIDFKQEHINEFLTYCREQFADNTAQLNNIDKLEKEYYRHQPIWWYTCDCFLYSMLNRALRTMEVDLIIKMGFFLRDLHNNIAALHTEQYGGQNHSGSFIVYRGQGLSPIDFDHLKKTEGGLISFNSFLSTSRDRALSFALAASNQDDPDLIGVLFKITINPSISSTFFADIHDVSAYQTEEEILFSMHSVFRIEQVEQIDGNNRLQQIDLILTSDKDPQLHALTESMREETDGWKGWHRLGQLMMQLGHVNKVEELYKTLLQQTTNEGDKARMYHTLGQAKFLQRKYADATTFYEKSIKILQKTLPANHSDLATAYNSIGLVYDSIGEYSKALLFHEKVLEIYQKTFPTNYPHLATSYNNIGLVYDHMDDYSKALSYYEKALELRQKTLPPNHPHLGNSYNNIGKMYDKMDKYTKALSYYEKGLAIRQRILPSNHPDLATSYNHIGSAYGSMGEYSKALSHYEKSIEISRKSIPLNHHDLATSYNNMGNLYYNMGEYSKAFSYCERALDILQRTLPPDHHCLQISRENIEMAKKKL